MRRRAALAKNSDKHPHGSCEQRVGPLFDGEMHPMMLAVLQLKGQILLLMPHLMLAGLQQQVMLDGYRVVCSSGMSGENDHEFNVTHPTTSQTFDNLVPGRLYTVSVYTYSGVDGAEDERVESNAVSETRRTKPNDVGSVTVERSNSSPNTSLDVSWTAATGDVDGYRVVCSSGMSGENDHEFNVTHPTTSQTFDNLVPGRLYTVSVYTYSGVDGAEDERVESNAVSETRRTKPNDVSSVTVERSNSSPNTSLDVS
ncbi:receptor-type tyrosine-protein phosphatase beta-like isoform X2 [Ptychodera flava]|uniref:receptor-type tyrosine-protein phosphatase beta-like isoform X2 n=1 Tax=Ptychodera flava TaxID=63121 RepID=UPI00396A1242